jgi:hypothetical protein
MKYVVNWSSLVRPASGGQAFRNADDWVWAYPRFFDWLSAHKKDEFIIITELLDPVDTEIIKHVQTKLPNFTFTETVPIHADIYIDVPDPLNARNTDWSQLLDLTPVEPSIQIYRKEIIICVGQPGGRRHSLAVAMGDQRNIRIVDDTVEDDELISIVDESIRTGFTRLIVDDTNHTRQQRKRYFDIAYRIKANVTVMWFTKPTTDAVDVETANQIEKYINEFERPDPMTIDDSRYVLIQSD